MPSLIYPLTQENILFARCFGHIAPADVINWNVEKQISAKGDSTLTALVDLSEVTSTDMTFDHMNVVYGKLARYYEARGLILHLVFYAPKDLAFGMTRILQSLSGMTDFVNVDIFRNPKNLPSYFPELNLDLDELRNLSVA
ncbi:hypothetical protein NBRC116601_10710 [Cognatishimia sp. WU-CL00825]|uniref:hypothetical protein n=1 Tax=Cognatishimia sp. WU-CL00825 TaxID=3127658 RepID=UPI003104BC36